MTGTSKDTADPLYTYDTLMMRYDIYKISYPSLPFCFLSVSFSLFFPFPFSPKSHLRKPKFAMRQEVGVRGQGARMGGSGCFSHPLLQHLLQVPLLLLLLFNVDSVKAATCPDGSAGLTRALYEGGDPTAYASVTCIPSKEFMNYEGNVELTGLALLTSIESEAFDSFKGKLVISGDYPSLVSVEWAAFECASNAASKVDLRGLNSAKFEFINRFAFQNFRGSYALPTGPFPQYKGCTRMYRIDLLLHAPTQIPLTKVLYEAAVGGGGGGVASFANVTCIPDGEFIFYSGDVTLNTGLESLQSIGDGAFQSSKGKLVIKGGYPSLVSVMWGPFYQAGTADSVVAIECSAPAGLTIHPQAFQGFKGKRNSTGEQTPCPETTMTTTSATSTTSSSATTATTTTSTTTTTSVASTTTTTVTPFSTSSISSTPSTPTTNANATTVGDKDGDGDGDDVNDSKDAFGNKINSSNKGSSSKGSSNNAPNEPDGAAGNLDDDVDDPTASTNPEPTNVGMIVGLAVGAIVLLTAIVAFIFWRPQCLCPCSSERDTHLAELAARAGAGASAEYANPTYMENHSFGSAACGGITREYAEIADLPKRGDDGKPAYAEPSKRQSDMYEAGHVLGAADHQGTQMYAPPSARQSELYDGGFVPGGNAHRLRGGNGNGKGAAASSGDTGDGNDEAKLKVSLDSDGYVADASINRGPTGPAHIYATPAADDELEGGGIDSNA